MLTEHNLRTVLLDGVVQSWGRIYLNFIEGANTTLTIEDNAPDENIDITISFS